LSSSIFSLEACKPRLPWYALQVWSRKETTICSQLEGQGFECFLPKYKSVRQWSDRKKEIQQPLFPGYVFCRFQFTERRPIVMTPGVLQVVGCGQVPVSVDYKEIEAIRAAVASGLRSLPWEYLKVGEFVRVNHGTLQGLEGILVNFKGNHRVVLSVSLLQRSVALEVDLAWVTKLSRAEERTGMRLVPGMTVPAEG
jgi:transcription antitermination factor NusG